MTMRRLDAIAIGARTRRERGDLTGLAASMGEVGRARAEDSSPRPAAE